MRQIVPLRYVVVHPDESRLAARLRETPMPGFRLLERVGRDDVYELTDAPDTGIALHRDFSSKFARAHPTAAFALRFEGADPEVTRWVEVSLNGRVLQRIDTGGAATLTLAPPYRRADRNELHFVHRYRVRPDVAAGDPYRIGATGARSPVDIELVSAGRGPQGEGGLVSARVNGHEVVAVPRRGYNVVALDAGDGHVLWGDNFDTFRSPAESRRMAERIAATPPGAIVLAGVKTDGGGQLGPEGVAPLHRRPAGSPAHPLARPRPHRGQGRAARLRRRGGGPGPRDGHGRAAAAARLHAGALQPPLSVRAAAALTRRAAPRARGA
jgi:hypothetical protein